MEDSPHETEHGQGVSIELRVFPKTRHCSPWQGVAPTEPTSWISCFVGTRVGGRVTGAHFSSREQMRVSVGFSACRALGNSCFRASEACLPFLQGNTAHL